MGSEEWGIFLGGGLLEFGEDLGEFVFGACEARAAVAQEFGSAACAFGKCVDIAVLGSELGEYFFEFGECLGVCGVGVGHFLFY